MGFFPEPNDKLAVEEFSDRLYFLPNGNHYLIVYSDLIKFRNIYTSFVRKQMTEQPNSVVLFLSYYETTQNVKKLFEDLEDKSSFKALDIMETLTGSYPQVPYAERIEELAKETKRAFEDNSLVVLADMSVFHHIKKSSELFEYEVLLHRQPKAQRWKEICFYHKRDFEAMFTDEQKKTLSRITMP